MKTLNESNYFYRKLMKIGIPVMIQNLIALSLNLIDTIMIGMMGEEELAAVGAANQVYIIFAVTLFGLFSGSAVYTAQYWGAQDVKGIRHLLGIDYMLAVISGIVVTVLGFIFAPQVIGIFSDDAEVIRLGVDYMRIAVITYTFSGLSFSISYNSRAIQRLLVPTCINACALTLNCVLNYVLIFGKLGFPALGVKGAAIATLTARIVELTAFLIYIYREKNHPFKGKFSEIFDFGRDLFSRVMKTAMPVVFTEGSWAVSVTMVFAAYGKLGTSALAVVQVAIVASDLLQSAFFGVGNATAMIIGEQLGKKNEDEAYSIGVKSIQVVMILNVVTTIALFALAKPISYIYGFSGETNDLLISTTRMLALLITPKMMGYIFIVGILRAGGDTVFCMKIELVCNMLIQIPMAYLAVMVLGANLPIAMALVCLGDVVRTFVSIPRFKGKKWINIVTD